MYNTDKLRSDGRAWARGYRQSSLDVRERQRRNFVSRVRAWWRALTASALVVLFVLAMAAPAFADVIDGSRKSDAIEGTRAPDYIWAHAGDDIVHGRRNADELFGGPGDDRLYGGRGADVLYGEGGYDVCVGGLGDDLFATTCEVAVQ